MLFVYYHHAHELGTFLVVKAPDAAASRAQLRELLDQPHYKKQDVGKLYGYQLTRDDSQEERYRDLFHKINTNLIRRWR